MTQPAAAANDSDLIVLRSRAGRGDERAHTRHGTHIPLVREVSDDVAGRVLTHLELLSDPLDARDLRSRGVRSILDASNDDLCDLYPNRSFWVWRNPIDHEAERSLPWQRSARQDRPHHARACLGMPISNQGNHGRARRRTATLAGLSGCAVAPLDSAKEQCMDEALAPSTTSPGPTTDPNIGRVRTLQQMYPAYRIFRSLGRPGSHERWWAARASVPTAREVAAGLRAILEHDTVEALLEDLARQTEISWRTQSY